jgi:hypothetical protein
MKRNLTLTTCALLISVSISAVAQGRRSAAPSFDRDATALALKTALDSAAGEYAARALYTAVIADPDVGSVQPFVNILAAEEKHIAALQAQWTKYIGNPVPSDSQAGTITFDGTIMDAALAGKEAEEENIAMYDELLAPLAEQPNLYPSSVAQVFRNLQSASENNHLPAFEAILAGDGTVTATACPQSGLQKQQRAGACHVNAAGQRANGARPMNCQLDCQNCPAPDCPNPGTGVKRQQRSNGQ